MRIIFMGSAALACPSLETLWAGNEDTLVAVVTQPDRPRGRSLQVGACPVRDLLLTRGPKGVPVLTPEKVNSPENLARLADLAPDLIVVVAYGQILKRALLDLPRLGCINIHGSLLPRYRGAAPVQWAIARGERVSGVTAMAMNERMDAGDILLKREVPISDDDTGGSLYEKLAREGAALLTETLTLVRSGRAIRVPQVESEATFAPKLSREDGRIDWRLTAAELHNRVRAFHPWPGSFCEWPTGSGKRLKVIESGVRSESGEIGTIIRLDGDGPVIGTGAGALCLRGVQPEGRKPMTGNAFLCGHGVKVGDRVA
jgi:methionyl-tRNA formyltransferase